MVRHRIDDLENNQKSDTDTNYVRHRIDDLEIKNLSPLYYLLVRHRIDDLESPWRSRKP